MRSQSLIASFIIAASIGCRADPDSQKCGEGTIEQNGICIAASDTDADADPDADTGADDTGEPDTGEPVVVDADDDGVPPIHDTIILFTIAISTALFGLYYLVLVLRVPNKHDAPFRQRLTAYASNSVLGTVLDLINAAYSFISCVFFVWDTYLTRPPIWMFALEVRAAVAVSAIARSRFPQRRRL